MARNRVFICSDHDRKWPVPATSVVVAPTEAQARKLLDANLIATGLKPYKDDPYTLTPVDMRKKPHVAEFNDGDY